MTSKNRNLSEQVADAQIKNWQRKRERALNELQQLSMQPIQNRDQELAYQSAKLRSERLDEMISDRKEKLQELARLEEAQRQAKNQDRAPLLQKIDRESKRAKELSQKTLRDLKDKHSQGLISRQALKNESQQEKFALKDILSRIRLQDPLLSLKEKRASLLHQLKADAKNKPRLLKTELADLRRKTPAEPGPDQSILAALLSFLLPGAGQALNGQWVKALLFFCGALFSWLIAVPYALGYGNYQGKGVLGLVSLAQGGRRVDRSLIFMIEGIVGVVLLLLALLILIFSARDAYKTAKAKSQGIRPDNWFETKQKLSESGFPILISSPAAILVLFMVLVPAFTTILLSFTNMDPKHQSKFGWNALNNYQILASGKGVAGNAFWLILRWTLVWTLAATSLAIFIGFVLALVVNQDRIRAKRLWRTIFLLPWAVPAFITIMFFSIMVAAQGPLAEILSSTFGQTINIKNDPTLTRLALILIQGWLGSSYIFLLCTGTLQSIPQDLYEAAEIDGATGFQKTRHITVPLLLFQISPLLITQFTFNFNNFSIIAIFNDGGPFVPSLYGNLAGSSDILVSFIYKLTINKQYQALGAAISVIISLLLMFMSYLGFRRSKAFQES